MMFRTMLAAVLVLVAHSASSQASQARGEKLFVSHCARCHGVGGTGGEGPSLTRPRLRHASDEASLVRVIQNGIEGTEMPPTWQISENEVRAIAAYVLSLGRVERAPVPGDATRGKALFKGKGGCLVCHMVSGEGGIVGPDLTDVGLRRGAAHLRESLVAPGASVTEGYLVVEAAASERSWTGVRVNEDSFTIQLRDERGRFHSLEKLELEMLSKKFGESLMPSYASDLTESELEDLVAYLVSMRGEP